MSAKDHKERKAVWRIRDKNGKWKELGAGEIPYIKLPEYEWSAVIPDETGLKIFTFNMN